MPLRERIGLALFRLALRALPRHRRDALCLALALGAAVLAEAGAPAYHPKYGVSEHLSDVPTVH
jgi:hypothetical protein